MCGIKNDSGIINAQYAFVGDLGKSLITHRNPANGYYWACDISNGSGIPGHWFPPEMVKFI